VFELGSISRKLYMQTFIIEILKLLVKEISFDFAGKDK
jgi:hypothetical protein